MQIHYDLDNFEAVNPVVTIGTFDGVHLGHREVISELKRITALSGGDSVVFTFEPHPRIVIAPHEDSLRLLSTISEKINLIEKIGIDHLVIYPFTIDFSRLSYSEFVTDILVGMMNISSLVVGYDHRFGQGRKGDFRSLELLSKALNFNVEQLSQLLVENKVVSSTKIRFALEAGDISKANHFLGYRYSVSGRVIEGKQLGRKLGFPTANIETFDRHKLVPGDGVYAVMVETGGMMYKGMLNVGIRPTVNYNADHKSIEVHIFDFDADIYNSEITLFFVEKIRDEQKFAGIVELQKQLIKDRISALNILLNKDL
ncbi:MAG: bifunctional riboflavin kinase/FAD synthetase [Bacteroidia bacterium]|nr:bifunctional riboflavin kinase/FAD synthetase [Bacteroidia bacterium]